MKNLFFFLLISFISNFCSAQVDTVLFEDFQENPFFDIALEFTGNDTDWVNYDEDGLPTILGSSNSLQWYGGDAFVNAFDSITGITEHVALSLSYLEDFLPGNRNWLILPPLDITDDSYMLHWESAPSQMPRYMDGYEVLLSTTGNNVNTDFSESLFKAASMDGITGDSQSTDYSNFTFTEGYLHADGGTDSTYIFPGITVNTGLLEPHSVDLSGYSGQTVYLAFLHNSDDDNIIAIDDILVTRSMASGSEDLVEDKFRIECYPNPVISSMNLSYRIQSNKEVQIQITDMNGRNLVQKHLGTVPPGVYVENIDLATLPAGAYQVILIIDKVHHQTNIVKK